MCFDYQELVLFSSDLKKFLQSTFYSKKAQFEMEFADFLWSTFPKLDDQFVATVFQNLDRSSANQNINCCVNFVLKLVVLSENARCVACTKEADKLFALRRSEKLREEADRQLAFTMEGRQFSASSLLGSLSGSDSYEERLFADPSSQPKRRKLTNQLNHRTTEAFDEHSPPSSLQQLLQEPADRSIMTRCSSANCLPCVTFMNYASYMHFNPCIQTRLRLITDLRFQDLQFAGVFVAHLKHNRICRDFYELLDRLNWSFSTVQVKLRSQSEDKIVRRKLLYTRLPIGLPEGIRLNQTRSSENQRTGASSSDQTNSSTVRYVKFFYDPMIYLSANLFGRNLLDKLQITVNRRTDTFSFEGNAKEFKLKEQKNINHEEFNFLNFVD